VVVGGVRGLLVIVGFSSRFFNVDGTRDGDSISKHDRWDRRAPGTRPVIRNLRFLIVTGSRCFRLPEGLCPSLADESFALVNGTAPIPHPSPRVDESLRLSFANQNASRSGDVGESSPTRGVHCYRTAVAVGAKRVRPCGARQREG